MHARFSTVLRILLVLQIACGATTRYSGPPMPVTTIDHEPFSILLSRYVTPAGGVDYGRWKASNDVQALDAYLGRLTSASPDSRPELFPTTAAALSYWVNLYNAIVIREVLRRWPLDSVRDVTPTLTSRWIAGKGFFYDLRFDVAGKRMNLRDLENAVIRDRFGDARIHFAINCASASCPTIGMDSFTPGDLEPRLELATLAFVNQPANVAVDHGRRTVTLSKIFEWYREDFQKHARSRRIGKGHVLDFVAHYGRGSLRRELETAIRGGYRVGYFAYDWSVNATTQRAPAKLRTTVEALVGTPWPAIGFTRLSGEALEIGALRGKTVVVDLWASYCRPCRAQLLELAALARDRPELVVVAVSLDDEQAPALALIRELKLDGATERIQFAHDPDQRAMGAPLHIGSLPSTIVVGPDGVVIPGL
jgi:thiol-disulfide isomerase/thioredoxin